MPIVTDLFDEALAAHRAGNFAQAEALYRQVILADPAHAHAHHLLGLLDHQAGRSMIAITRIRQAITLEPNFPSFHANLGVALRACGQTDEAGSCYRRALELNPNMVEAHYNLGNICKDQGNVPEAIACYRRALQLNPQSVDALANLGVALRDQGQLDEAVATYRQVLRIAPDHFIAQHNLGIALMDLGQSAAAADSFRQAIVRNPGNADSHTNLGIVLKELGQLDEAIACCRQALTLDPTHVNAHITLGIALSDLGMMAEAADCFKQTLRLNPEQPSARFCLALRHLALGDYLSAWSDYEYRWQLPGATLYHAERPRWDGRRLDGKTILLHAEQGFGDTLHFIRYAPLVKAKGGTVVVECQPHLVTLLKRMAGIDQVVADDAPPPPFDVQAPLMSLPGIFGTTLETIPKTIPYAYADAALVEHWRQAIASATTDDATDGSALPGLKIGIAWQGRATRKGDCYRSVPLRAFEGLAGIPGIRLVSLQTGPAIKQLAQVPFSVVDLGSRFDPNSLEDLAAVLKNIDLVVTVDTAVAHLAGALGVNAWVALHIAPCWRWLEERSDSPWYPTLRLFRQRRPGDWDEVFVNIAAELQRHIRKASTP